MHTNKKPRLILVDDDPLIIDSFSVSLQEDFEILVAESREQANSKLKKINDVPCIALIDLGLPPFPHLPDEGFYLIKELLAINDDIKILVLSGQNEQANIQHALALGAVDFIPKPCEVALLKARLQHQLATLKAEQAQADNSRREKQFIGKSEAIKTLMGLIEQFAATPYPVLIEGESGTGKELVAKLLHEKCGQPTAPYLTINCAAFTPELLDSQLFGHAKGAFTGAAAARAGFFEDAKEGTLFLDEIGELPFRLQSKLLRVLENGEFYRIGETQPRQSRARIIIATNRDLREEIRAGRFRQDLYHRLSVLTIYVPPLRERGDDCLYLFEHFQGLYVNDMPPFKLDKWAKKYLLRYRFPGNVRELRNIVVRLCAKYPGGFISVDVLQAELDVDDIVDAGSGTDMLQQELMKESFCLDEQLLDWEKKYIDIALRLSGGNLSKAARMLGVNRTTLYSRIQRLGIPKSTVSTYAR